VAGLIAVALASVNIFGGFAVTQRMLACTRRRSAAMHEAAAHPSWVLLAYLISGVCFILALRGLSSPDSSRGAIDRHARHGDCGGDDACRPRDWFSDRNRCGYRHGGAGLA
jgi:hypothetical protein